MKIYIFINYGLNSASHKDLLNSGFLYSGLRSRQSKALKVYCVNKKTVIDAE